MHDIFKFFRTDDTDKPSSSGVKRPRTSIDVSGKVYNNNSRCMEN